MIDVLISGAGASGLSLAIDLARRGVSFRIIDKIDTPFGGSRGKGIQPRTLEVFEDLGVLDRIAAAGGPYPTQRHHRADGSSHDKRNIALDAPTASEPYRTPQLVPQFRSEAVLRERLAEFGAAPEYGRELLGFEQADEGVTAQVAGPDGTEAVVCRFLVAADGGRSFVRQALDLDFPGKTLGVRALVADILLEGLARDAWHRFNDDDLARMISFCPFPHSDAFQLQGPIPGEAEIDLSAAGLQAYIDERLPKGAVVVRDVIWASDYSMNARLAERYRVGRVLLVGDAAHIHPPTGGQGLNTSVQDAHNLGWKLGAALAGAPDWVLDSYEAERRPIAAGMLGLATRLLEKAGEGDLDRGREVHQLDLGYRGSPLSLETGRNAAAIAPGDRAPDAPMRGAAGQPIRAFDLLRGTHWSLLGYEVDDMIVPGRRGLHVHAIGARGDIRDEGGHFRDAYALAPGEWVLVRPDGYVAGLFESGDVSALEAYLASVGMAGPGRPAVRPDRHLCGIGA